MRSGSNCTLKRREEKLRAGLMSDSKVYLAAHYSSPMNLPVFVKVLQPLQDFFEHRSNAGLIQHAILVLTTWDDVLDYVQHRAWERAEACHKTRWHNILDLLNLCRGATTIRWTSSFWLLVIKGSSDRKHLCKIKLKVGQMQVSSAVSFSSILDTYPHWAASSPATAHPSPQRRYNKTQCLGGGTGS